MLWSVLKKELIEYFTGVRFWAGVVATLAISGVVWWAGGEDYRLRWARWDGQQAGHESELTKARTYSQAQPTVVRAPEPLSILEPGFDPRLGTVVRIVPFRVPFEATSPSHGNELLSAAPEVGLAALVGVVLGFFSLLLTFDSFARERESGSLRLLEAQGLTTGRILLGKYLAGITALSLPLAVSLALAAERLDAAAGDLTGDQWLRVGCLFLACLGYLSCSTLWGLAFSLKAPSRTAALTRAIEAWLLTILILPAVVGNSAHQFPWSEDGRRKLDARIRALEEERAERIRRLPWPSGFTAENPVYRNTDSATRTILLRFGSQSYYDRTSTNYVEEARINEVYAEKIAQVERQREASFATGERLFAAVAAISPRHLLDRMAQAFAGTSYADHRRFLVACQDYRKRVNAYFTRIGAFSSWRWFTDDLPGKTHPWPLFLGLTPEEIAPGVAEETAVALGRLEIDGEMQRYHTVSESDPERRLDLEGLPRFSPPETPLSLRLRQVSGEALALLLFHLGALAYCSRGWRSGARP